MMACYTRRNAGFSLMEVLISALVLSIGLLGIAGLQVAGVKSGHSVYYRTQATMLANAIMDRMRSNAKVARADGYNVPSIKEYSNSGSAQEVADLKAWKENLSDIFPSFDGSIDCTSDGVCRVTVQWDDSKPEILLEDGDDPSPPPEGNSRKNTSSERRFSMRTRL